MLLRIRNTIIPPRPERGGGMDVEMRCKVLAFAFGLSAEIERNLISQRTKEALARKKAEGVKLGRPKGGKIIRTSTNCRGKNHTSGARLIKEHLCGRLRADVMWTGTLYTVSWIKTCKKTIFQ